MTELLRGIPLWVYALFFFLIYRGILAAKKNSVTKLKKIIIIPALYFFLAIQKINDPTIFIIFIIVGAGIGYYLYHNTELRADKEKMLIELPGSILPLILMLIAFGKGYFFGYERAIHPEYNHQFWFLCIEYIINGAVTGVFAGRALAYFIKFKQANHTELEEPAKKSDQ